MSMPELPDLRDLQERYPLESVEASSLQQHEIPGDQWKPMMGYESISQTMFPGPTRITVGSSMEGKHKMSGEGEIESPALVRTFLTARHVGHYWNLVFRKVGISIPK